MRDVLVSHKWIEKGKSTKARHSTQLKLHCVLLMKVDFQDFKASGLLQLMMVKILVTLNWNYRKDHGLRLSFVYLYFVNLQDFTSFSNCSLKVTYWVCFNIYIIMLRSSFWYITFIILPIRSPKRSSKANFPVLLPFEQYTDPDSFPVLSLCVHSCHMCLLLF